MSQCILHVEKWFCSEIYLRCRGGTEKCKQKGQVLKELGTTILGVTSYITLHS